MRVSRAQLYEEVWQQPMTKVAAKYGVSSVALKSACERLRIPTPGRGHWQRLEAGKPSERPALPAPQPGDPLEYTRGDERAPEREPWPAPKPPTRAAQPVATLPFGKGEHPLVTAGRTMFVGAPVAMGTDYLRPRKHGLDIVVSESALEAAFTLANLLYVFLERRRYRVALAPAQQPLHRKEFDHSRQDRRPEYWFRGAGKPTVTLVGTVAFGLTVFESTEKKEGRYVGGEWKPLTPAEAERRRKPRSGAYDDVWERLTPSGRLGIHAYSPYVGVDAEWVWEDVTASDEFFAKLVGTLEREAKSIADRVAAWDKQRREEHARFLVQMEEHRKRQAEVQRQQEEAGRKKAIEASRQDLVVRIREWDEACLIAEFLQVLQSEVLQLPEEEQLLMKGRLEIASTVLRSTSPLAHFRRWRAPNGS